MIMYGELLLPCERFSKKNGRETKKLLEGSEVSLSLSEYKRSNHENTIDNYGFIEFV